jgi:N-acetylglucosaminyldiphosphoundecaprenol N-acetyl-beta-D-mannosaminyltransferase
LGVYILGARAAVLETAIERLRSERPGLLLSGYRDGYFDESESPRVAEAIRESGARILFVAMSSPRKENWLAANGAASGVALAMGVGGAIDVVAGVTRRAPRIWQQLGLEWLFRLLQEPGRMFPRYFGSNLRFCAMVARALVRRLSNAWSGKSPGEVR